MPQTYMRTWFGSIGANASTRRDNVLWMRKLMGNGAAARGAAGRESLKEIRGDGESGKRGAKTAGGLRGAGCASAATGPSHTMNSL